jgi:hypothetical protein
MDSSAILLWRRAVTNSNFICLAGFCIIGETYMPSGNVCAWKEVEFRLLLVLLWLLDYLQQQKIPRPQILVPQNISNFDFPIFF